MYIAACDDQFHELDSVICLLDRWRVKRDAALQYKVFQSAVELLDAAEKEHFTLYLLDVMMPGMDGMAAAREIRSLDETAEIVFLTSSTDFAYASYGVRALDYLLKPIQPEKLYGVLDRILFREEEPRDDLLLKCGAALVRIPYSRLSHVEVINKRLFYYLTDGTVKEVTGRMKDCENVLLARPEFKRIHRSFIVNLLNVTELSPSMAKTVTGQVLPVARGLHRDLEKDYVNLLFSGGGRT